MISLIHQWLLFLCPALNLSRTFQRVVRIVTDGTRLKLSAVFCHYKPAIRQKTRAFRGYQNHFFHKATFSSCTQDPGELVTFQTEEELSTLRHRACILHAK